MEQYSTFRAKVRYNDVVITVYSKLQLLRLFRPHSEWTNAVVSSYFTPSKLKKWDLPKYLKDNVISIKSKGITYEQTANNR